MKRNALHAISLVAVLTLITKGLGMVRDILQARAFGATAEVDLFTAVNNGTIYLFTTAAYALCLAAVPIFAGKLAKDREDAVNSANNIITITTLLSVVVTALMIVAANLGLLGSGVGESGHSFDWYASVMSLTLPVIVVTYLLMALFQAMGHYSLQGSLSLLYNIVLCGMLLFAGPSMSVPEFTVAVSAAWILQFAMTLPHVFREKYRYRFRLDFKAPELKTYFLTAVVTAFTTSAFLLCYLLDTRQSATLGAGVTSAFYYADKLFTPITTTLIYSIGAVMFPKWSEKYAQMQDGEYRAYVGKVVENTYVLMLPLSAICSVFGVPIVRVLFEGGSFDVSASNLTGRIFACYTLGMVGFALLDLMAKAYYAMGKTRVPLIVNLAVIAANFVCNALILRLAPNTALVAAGTTVVMTLGGAALIAAFFRRSFRVVFSVRRIVRGTLASAVIYAALSVASGVLVAADDSKLMLVVKCGALGVAAFGIYILLMGHDLIIKKGNRT